MKFAASLVGITPKDTSDGLRIEIKLVVQFDSQLFAELGECFGDRVAVGINDPQLHLDLEEEEEPAEARS
jgi:hypothetical protein